MEGEEYEYVWTYWKCQYCLSMMRGDCKKCQCCGCSIPVGVKYLMPDDPEVVEAIKCNAVLIAPNVHVVESDIVQVVPEELRNDNPNWICESCGSQNSFEKEICESCGKSKELAKVDYFGNSLDKKEEDITNSSNIKKDTVIEIDSPSKSEPEQKLEPNNKYVNKSKSKLKLKTVGKCLIYILIFLYLLSMAIFLLWFFIPVRKVGTVEEIGWSRNIEILELVKFRENDWKLPQNATLIETKNEVHHYDRVFSHYERRKKTHSDDSRGVSSHKSHKSHSGGSSSSSSSSKKSSSGHKFHDLGNGQARRRKSKSKHKRFVKRDDEYYDEAVYRNKPVYRTKYYYDIGRWVNVDNLKTQGKDKNPYWAKTNIPENVPIPTYGAKKLGKKTETYSLYIASTKFEYDFEEWKNVSVGDEVTYETNRYSSKPKDRPILIKN